MNIDNTINKRWQMIGHKLRYGDELHSLIIEGTQSRERPRMKYIRKIMKDARVTSYRELKVMVNDTEKWAGHYRKY